MSGRVHRPGFTLMEIVVAIAVVALLAGVSAPLLFRHVADARVSAARAELSTLGIALETFALHTGRYPLDREGLDALVKAPQELADTWRGPYLRGGVPKDPWTNPYVYRVKLADGDYVLMSEGRDGRPGGVGEDADIILGQRMAQ